MKKIDLHVHCVPERDLPKQSGHYYPTPAELRTMYDRLGIEKGVLMPPGTASEFTTDRVSPREARRMVAENSGTLGWWFCGIDPRFGSNSPKTDFSHYLRYYRAQGARGVSELIANLYLDDPRMMNLFAHCEQCEMPVTLHFGRMGMEYGVVDDGGLPRLEKVLKTFPALRLIGHSTRFWSELSGDVTDETRDTVFRQPKKVTPGGRVVELLRSYPNLLCDLSSLSGYFALARDEEFACRFLEEFQDKIFFATDIHDPENALPGNPGYDMLKLSAFLDGLEAKGAISRLAYEKICRRNALRLLEGETYADD